MITAGALLVSYIFLAFIVAVPVAKVSLCNRVTAEGTIEELDSSIATCWKAANEAISVFYILSDNKAGSLPIETTEERV